MLVIKMLRLYSIVGESRESFLSDFPKQIGGVPSGEVPICFAIKKNSNPNRWKVISRSDPCFSGLSKLQAGEIYLRSRWQKFMHLEIGAYGSRNGYSNIF